MESLDRLAYTFDTAAAAVGRTRSTIVRLVGQGVIKAEWRGGQQMILRDELMRWLNEGEGDNKPSGAAGTLSRLSRHGGAAKGQPELQRRRGGRRPNDTG
jgi:excisionase family DNA binding protein